MVNWSEKDCRQLIELWSEEKVQVMLTSSHRNISVFRELSENLNRFTESGQTFTAEQCRAKKPKIIFNMIASASEAMIENTAMSLYLERFYGNDRY